MLAVVMCLAAMHPAAVPQSELRGGSNYFTYRVDEDCTREPYGVVNSYDQAPELVRDQLAQMARAGQKRLRIPVFHHRGADSGTVMDSGGGGVSRANLSNLRELLKDVRAAGFEAVEIAFFPKDANDTDRHGNTHALARRFGIMYMIWNRRIWEAYRADRGWTPYTGRSPHTDHVHFSFSRAGARKETTWWTRPTHSMPRVSVGVPSVVDTGSGMVILGVDPGGGITHRWQNTPGWCVVGVDPAGPAGAGGGRAAVPAGGSYGKLAVFVRGGDGALWHTWQSETGAWAPDWVSPGGRLASDPAVVLSPNGALSRLRPGSGSPAHTHLAARPRTRTRLARQLGGHGRQRGRPADPPGRAGRRDGRLGLIRSGGRGSTGLCADGVVRGAATG